MKREFFKHGAVYATANALAGAGSILLVPIYTRSLLPLEYGVVDYVGVIQILVQVCGGLEMTQAVARFYASSPDAVARRSFASTGLWFLLASYAAICALFYVGAHLWGGEFLGIRPGSSLFVLALASIYVRSLFYALQSQLRWELRSDLYSIASVVAVGVTTVAAAYLLLIRNAALTGAFTAIILGYGTACVFCLSSLRGTYRWHFDPARFRKMFVFALPLALASLAMFLVSYGDRLVVRSLLGLHELGVYAIGARVAAVITLAINGFQLGAWPLIFRHFDEPQTPPALAQMMRAFLAIGLVGVCALAAVSVELLQLFASAEYGAAWRLIPILALAIVITGLSTFTPGLTVRNLTPRVALINITTAIVTVVLTVGFLRVAGPLGAAVGALSGAVIGFLLHAQASQRVYPLPIDWQRLGHGLLAALVAIIVSQFLGSHGWGWLAARLLVLIGATIAIAVGLLSNAERAAAVRVALTRFPLSRWSAPDRTSNQ